MTGGLKRVMSLKSRSLDELRVRSAQALASLSERYSLSAQTRIPKDAALLQKLNGARESHGLNSAEALLAHFRQRRSPEFFASFDDREATLAELCRRWPEGEETVVAEAEMIARGRFKLLGLDDLHFGDPVDWHLEPVANKRAPRRHWSCIDYLDARQVGDKKIIWELNRCQHFVTLGQAYWYTRDERHAATFIAQLTGWMEANPPKQGINWASSLEVALRAISWLWALHFFSESPHLTPEIFSHTLKFLYLHARHLETYLSTYFSPNTHLTGEALGLFYLGLLLPEFQSAGRWRALGQRILLEQIDRHVRPDGVYFEQASYYHRYTTDFYTHFYILSEMEARHRKPETASRVGERLAALLDHLMHLTKPDGTSPLIGDDDGGRLIKLDGLNRRDACDFRAALSTGAALFKRGDYKHVADGVAEETLWLLGPEGVRQFDRLVGRPPTASSRAFADGGYYAMRDGWGSEGSYLLIDCGPHGALSSGHSHADALSFEFATGGASWLVDSGTYTYTGDASARDEYRSSAAHNTLTVDGQSQSTPSGPFSWSQTAESRLKEFIAEKRFDYFAGEHDGYRRLADPVTHLRSTLFVKADGAHALPAYVVVRDICAAGARHRYALHYHFHPACRVTAQNGNLLRATRDDAGELIFHVYGSGALQTRVGEGRVSHCYGRSEPAPVALVESEGEGACSFVTCIIPTPGPIPDPAPGMASEQFLVECEQGGASILNECRLIIRSGAVCDTVLLGDGDSRVEYGSLAACGEMAWARAVNGRVVLAGLVRGYFLECADGFAFHSPAAVKSCAIERRLGEIEISVSEARCFHLTLTEPVTRVIINGERLKLAPFLRRGGFALDGAGWRLREIDC